MRTECICVFGMDIKIKNNFSLTALTGWSCLLRGNVFPVRYKLNLYVLFRRNSVFKELRDQSKHVDWSFRPFCWLIRTGTISHNINAAIFSRYVIALRQQFFQRRAKCSQRASGNNYIEEGFCWRVGWRMKGFLIWKVRLLLKYMLLQLRRWYSAQSLLWEPQILHETRFV
jgi:hypothetical protein